MSTEANKALVRRLLAAGQAGDLAVLDAIIDADVIDHAAFPGQPPGLEGVKEGFAVFRAAFPDLQITVEDMIAAADTVVSRITISGTQHGTFFGIPPTGRRVSISGIHIHQIDGGKVSEHWGCNDDLGMLQQLGAIPAPGQAGG